MLDSDRFENVAGALTELMPVEAAERLATHLTTGDVETLRDLVRAAVPDNTIRAVASDLGYLEAWARAATGEPLAWPPAEADVLKFIAHHLFRAEERKARREASEDTDDYGMPRAVEFTLREQGILRGALPHAPATVARRLSSWRRVAQVKGYEDALSSSVLRRALNAASKASTHQKRPKSETAITRNVLYQLVGEKEKPSQELLSLREIRDGTLLLVGFGTGGRRRSELGTLRIENVFDLDEGKARGIHIGRTKTTNATDGEYLVVTGRADAYLKAWLEALAKQDPAITNGA
ncbi:MAG: integrase, partial [Marinicaulis sp.]|nr:integrase [Marinicaulis sp.]